MGPAPQLLGAIRISAGEAEEDNGVAVKFFVRRLHDRRLDDAGAGMRRDPIRDLLADRLTVPGPVGRKNLHQIDRLLARPRRLELAIHELLAAFGQCKLTRGLCRLRVDRIRHPRKSASLRVQERQLDFRDRMSGTVRGGR